MNHFQPRPELARRIVWEAEAVRAKFPGLFRLVIDVRDQLAWVGSVPVEGRPFPIRVTYPPAYPAIPPKLQTTAPLPPGCPHLLERAEGRSTLCWIASSAQGPRRRWDPQRHTAATALRSALRWGLALRNGKPRKRATAK
ncbi:MAG TPA: hypothetical protein VMG10_12540 [Gemmataceae bacterium]|nr:hypothetical protein [Gemmataceae bacterium]